MADQPIVISHLSTTKYDLDQSTFEGVELYPGEAYYGITIGPNTVISSDTFKNIDVAGGKGALSWVDHGHPATTSLMIAITNVRHEQGKDSSAYSWLIDRSGATHGAFGITFQDVGAAGEENGFYLRNVQKVMLIDAQSPRQGGIALNADRSAYDLHLISPLFAEGSLVKNDSSSYSPTGVDYFLNGGAIRTGVATGQFFLDVGNLVVRKGDGAVGGSIATSSEEPALSGSLRLAKDDVIAWRNEGNTSDIRLGKRDNDHLAIDGVEIPTVSSRDELRNKTLINPKLRGPKISDPMFENIGSTSHVICWKTSSKLGYCSTKPDDTGACICN